MNPLTQSRRKVPPKGAVREGHPPLPLGCLCFFTQHLYCPVSTRGSTCPQNLVPNWGRGATMRHDPVDWPGATFVRGCQLLEGGLVVILRPWFPLVLIKTSESDWHVPETLLPFLQVFFPFPSHFQGSSGERQTERVGPSSSRDRCMGACPFRGGLAAACVGWGLLLSSRCEHSSAVQGPRRGENSSSISGRRAGGTAFGWTLQRSQRPQMK